MQNLFKGVAEYFTPVLKDSGFVEKGVLTPEEFVKAGDELVQNCPGWSWESGTEALKKSYLPDKKQYLITRGVPSLVRAHTYALKDAKESVVEAGEGIDDDGWLATHQGDEQKKLGDQTRGKKSGVEDIGELGDDGEIKGGEEAKLLTGISGLSFVDDYVSKPPEEERQDKPWTEKEQKELEQKMREKQLREEEAKKAKEEVGSMDDLEGMGSLIEEPQDEATLSSKGVPEDLLVRTRTYDLSITYDKYYRTPRLFLFGYNEQGQPLSTDEIMEDISTDHAHKTVTVDPHPHTGVSHASIHPCKHADVMKRICDQLLENYKEQKAQERGAKPGSKPGSADEDIERRLNVSQYLFLFLKFISSVIPTIEYDFSKSV